MAIARLAPAPDCAMSPPLLVSMTMRSVKFSMYGPRSGHSRTRMGAAVPSRALVRADSDPSEPLLTGAGPNRSVMRSL